MTFTDPVNFVQGHTLSVFRRSVPDGVSQVHVWSSAEDACEGNVKKAVFSEKIDSNERDESLSIPFPLLAKDKTGRAYQIAFIHSEDQRSGWVRVVPGEKDAWRVYVIMKQWELARSCGKMLGITSRITKRKDLSHDIPAMNKICLENLAGSTALWGLKEKSAIHRATNIPELTSTLKANQKYVLSFNKENKKKIHKLLDFLRNAKPESDVWIPLSSLP